MKKICVYAIAKNEIKFIERWYNSVKEADYICVLDTGSTDGTFEKLKSLNIITKQIHYKNFRFDKARNDSLSLIPKDSDICVCVDLDEVFIPGWANTLRNNWKENTTRARYRYTWNFNPDGSEGIVFMLDKIHKKDYYIWKHPVHEVLTPLQNKEEIIINTPIQLNHYADTTKSRSSYLPLLELSVKEDPEDDRNTHYLAREYLFHGYYKKAITTFKKHLRLKSATWDLERCASLRYIAYCYKQLNRPALQKQFLIKAILEANYIREPYYDLAIYYYEHKKYLEAILFFNEMLKITDRTLTYMSQPQCWNNSVYDYLSICYYEIGDLKNSLKNIEIAIKLNPEKRLIKNKEFIISKINNN